MMEDTNTKAKVYIDHMVIVSDERTHYRLLLDVVSSKESCETISDTYECVTYCKTQEKVKVHFSTEALLCQQ